MVEIMMAFCVPSIISDNYPIPLQSTTILLMKNIQKVISTILLIFFVIPIFKESNDSRN